jgi:hypothetical protein
VNIPLSLKLYAGLAFLGGLAALWRGVDLLLHDASGVGTAIESLWAAFQIALGIGILRLHPAARIVALICCWFTFTVFGIVLVCWCIWPLLVSVATVTTAAAAAAMNVYFYILFRRTEIRAMFHLVSSRPL